MTTIHNAYDLGIGDKKFKWIMLLGVPSIGLILGFICGSLLPCYLFDCKTDVGKNFSDVAFYGFYGIGIACFFIVRNFTKELYNRGPKIYAALDRQNDKCLTCNGIIKPTDEYYFTNNNVYCIKDHPQNTKEAGGLS